MLNRDTDLTSDRLFHNKISFKRESKAITKIKSELLGFFDYIQLDTLNSVSSNKILEFKLRLGKRGIFFSKKDEHILKYHFFGEDKYCERCGREFSLLNLVDSKHYCLQVPNKAYNLCRDCDGMLKKEVGEGGFIFELFKEKDKGNTNIFNEVL